MKVKDERDKLEGLLEASSDKIADDVPTPGNIPEELEQSTMGIDFDELRDKCNTEARIMINNAIGFILPEEMIKGNAYLKNKVEVDVMSLAGMIYQLRANEAMQKAMMEEVDRGFMHPRMFEVFSGLSKTIAEINKQLLGTVEAIKMTYKDVKSDIKDQQTEALGGGDSMGGMLQQGDGGVVSMGTKELINSIKKRPESDNDNVQDVEEVA
jgi:hypothetical protein